MKRYYAYNTWEAGLAVAAKPQLMRPLHDVLALAEVLDVVEPAAQQKRAAAAPSTW